jgi:hypothetical protein
MNAALSTSTRPNATRKRVVGGGIVAGLLALAWWWSGLNRGPGPGEDGSSDQQASDVTQDETGRTDLDSDNEDSPSPGHGDRLTVKISGSDYLISHGDVFELATLEEVIYAAERVDGDEDGIKVRILHDRTGVSGAQTDLEQALADAGLTRDQWQTVQQPVP